VPLRKAVRRRSPLPGNAAPPVGRAPAAAGDAVQQAADRPTGV